MIFFALIIGVILIVAAVRNSQGSLFSALGQDVPAFVVWASAIFALGALGFVPGLKPVSRGLLALVLVVLILRNYKQILSGFNNAYQNPPAYAPGKADSAATPAPATGAAVSNTSGAQSLLDLFGGSDPNASVTGAF
jgi:hypothetical protein